MIRIQPATKESRPRDRKRYRAVLSVGGRGIHLTLAELSDLIADARMVYGVLARRKRAADVIRKAKVPPTFTWGGERFGPKGGGR